MDMRFAMSLELDEAVMSSRIPILLGRYTTPEERQMIAGWVRYRCARYVASDAEPV